MTSEGQFIPVHVEVLSFAQLFNESVFPLPLLAKELATLSSRVDEHLKKMGAVWN